MIRVLLAEDHTLVRKGLRSLLEAESDIEVVGEAQNGRESLIKAREFHPDIVVMDISMPDLNGLEATRRLKEDLPNIAVLVLTMHADEEYVFQFLRAGAAGYVLKQAAPSELIMAIHAVFQGKSFLSPSISRTVIEGYVKRTERATPPDSYDLLTRREREVLQLLAEGLSTRCAAERLCISVKTIETHRAHIMEKLEFRTTAALVRYAIRKGIILPEE